VDHIGEHGILPYEAEYVIDHAVRPWPQKTGEGRYQVLGLGPDGSYLHSGIHFQSAGCGVVIHARLMRDIEKRRYRRRLR
jgi:hypothetical protein